jgi:hypothetical protein
MENGTEAPPVPPLNGWVRVVLVAIIASLSLVFGIAAWLNPYLPDGSARRMETHRQMGLPECTFKERTGIPCPSCGMTTSFALLVRGDVLNSLRANAVGTMLATVGLAFIPWGLACVVRKRLLFIESLERALMIVIFGFVGLMLLRWVLVIGLMWWHGML